MQTIFNGKNFESSKAVITIRFLRFWRMFPGTKVFGNFVISIFSLNQHLIVNSGLEVENQNLQYEIEQVRQASVPENVARISAKLSVMERERQKRENDLRMTLMSRDPKAQHMIADQTHQITKLKTELNAKTNLYAK